MGRMQRVMWAVLLVVADGVIFFLPLAGLFLAYVIIVNPQWFREFLGRLDES